VDEILVVYSDLTQLDGEPTNRATLRIERVPVGQNAGEASVAFVVATLAAMAAMACAAGIGSWIGATTSLIMMCSVLVFVFVLVAGVSSLRRL
jgi:hypothetical protein